MKKASCFIVLASLILVCSFAFAPPTGAVTLNFEGLAEWTSVTNQYAGVTFSGATVLTAGMSLNELEFPPFSGVNVVLDSGGPITGQFTIPVSNFGAHYTYNSQLTLTVWDTSNALLGSLNSSYSANTALSGNPGSVPNEFLSMSFASGISRFEIVGNSSGSSFVMDDFQFTPIVPPTVPDASALLLGAMGMSALWASRRFYSAKNKSF
jgi:hypothetical protein